MKLFEVKTDLTSFTYPAVKITTVCLINCIQEELTQAYSVQAL